MTTIDNIMALALNYRLAGSASRDEHEEALRSALTEAGKEAFALGMAVRPASAAQLSQLTRSCTLCGYCAATGEKIQTAQPVRGPSCETCKHCTVASQQSFEETCLVCSQNYYNKYEAKK